MASASQVEAASLTLTWTENSTNVDGFRIERLTGSTYSQIASVAGDVRSYTDSGLITGTTYCYQVRAFNAAGTSAFSNQACAVAQQSILSVSPTTITPGGAIRATWSGIAAPSTTDWIGLYAPGAANTQYIDWIYVSCSKNPGSARASGSCSFVVPPTLSAGGYELRLLLNDGYTRLATSNPFTVTGGMTTLTLNPTTTARGSTATAIWSGITTPAPKDWIGLYSPGAPNTSFIDWIYVSCSNIPAIARASGSCSFVVPSTLSAGGYELRLLANDGYTRLATSNAFTVNTVTVLSVGGGSASNSTVTTSQLWSYWTDYRVTLKMRSNDDNSIGVMFRYQDNRNYYRFSWDRQRASRRLVKMENGVPTVLAEDAVPYVSGQTYQLQIVAQGTTLEVWIDSTPIFSATDMSFNWGTIALYSWYNQGSIFDDILVEDLATGAVLLSEDFNDGNFTGWTIVDDKGTRLGPSVWSAETGSLVQSSNIGSSTSSNLGAFALYTKRNWSNYRLALKMRSADDGSIGVMFRYLDNNNYYRFSWDKQRFSRRLVKLENGVLTVLAEDAVPYVIGQTYQLQIVAQGTTLEVWIDGTLIFSVTDASFDGGTIALYSWYNQGSTFDDVLVEDLATGTVLLWDDFNDGNFTGWTIVDEGTTNGPSAWSAQTGALVQSSNIGSDTSSNLGTFALY